MKATETIVEDFVQQWMDKAEEDLEAARHLLKSDFLLPYPVAFHAQQAAEKYLKALLVHHQIEFPKVHDFGPILNLVADIDKALADELQILIELDPYGVTARYPGDVPTPLIDEAKRALEVAEAACELILQKLGA